MNKEALIQDLAQYIADFEEEMGESFVDYFLHDRVEPSEFMEFVNKNGLNPIVDGMPLFIQAEQDYDQETYEPSNRDYTAARLVYAKLIASSAYYIRLLVEFAKEDAMRYPEFAMVAKAYGEYFSLGHLIIADWGRLSSFIKNSIPFKDIHEFASSMKLNVSNTTGNTIFKNGYEETHSAIVLDDFAYMCRIYALYICLYSIKLPE